NKSKYLYIWISQKQHIANFFLSSRRRHTRFSRDWSSDVCSSDLWIEMGYWAGCEDYMQVRRCYEALARDYPRSDENIWGSSQLRSEERRVGKECRYRSQAEIERKSHRDVKDEAK